MYNYTDRNNFDIEKLIFRAKDSRVTHEYNCHLRRLLPAVEGVNTKRGISEFGAIMVNVESKTAVDRHRHDEEELFFVIDGSANLEIENQSTTISPGDAVYIPRYWQHQIKNPGDGNFRFMDIYWDNQNRDIEEYESDVKSREKCLS